MATNQPLPDREPPRAADPAAAQQLAAALRRARLTLLCGEAGSGKSALVVDGLLPLLRRRGSDAAVSVARRTSPTVLPFPERRSRDDRAALAEFVILLNAGDTPSQTSLHDGIDAALRAAHVDPEWYREPLAERVQSLGSRFGTRFLFVLDGFEAVLQAAETDAACADLLDELVQLLNAPLQANLLLVLRAEAEVLLAPLLDRLRAVRPEVLMLEGGRTRRVYGAATAAPATPEPQAAAKPKPTELSQFDNAGMPEAANTGAPTRPVDLGPAPVARVERARSMRQVKALPQLSGQRRSPTRRFLAFASVALLAIVGGAALFRLAMPGEHDAPLESATPPPAAGPTATPAAPPAATPAATIAATSPAVPTATLPAAPPAKAPAALPFRPSFALQVDADSADTQLPRELTRALAADSGAEVHIVPTPLAVPARSAGSTGLAVVRYDALQAAARGGAKPDLAVVAPLYTEELQIVVRADSKLRFIHQIEGKRINVGAAQGARALTARALYRQMFDRPLPTTPRAQLDAAPALQRLIEGDGIDAVVLVGAQPAAALAALPPWQRDRVKLLELAPSDPVSRRALQAYLPATLREPSGATAPTLAAMSFLVTTGRPDAATAATLGRLATSLCRQLPALQRNGDAKWRELRAGLQLDTGWPPAGAADAAWRACAGGSVSRASTSPSPATPTRN